MPSQLGIAVTLPSDTLSSAPHFNACLAGYLFWLHNFCLFFFFFFFFFNDFSDTNYLRIRYTDFRNLFTEWKRFGCRWSNWTSIFDISRDVAMATDFVQKWQTPQFVALAFRNGIGYRYLNVRINSPNDACISCENFVQIVPVTPELTAHLWMSGMTRPKNRHIWSNIFRSTGPIFAIFSPSKSAFGADDGSGPYFPISQGTLP